MAKRKKRPGEVVCECGVYPFPHRQFGGICTSTVLDDTWRDHQFDTCRSCPLFEEDEYGTGQCPVIEGRETFHEAPCVIEHVQFEGIKLYGMNKPPEKRMGWRR